MQRQAALQNQAMINRAALNQQGALFQNQLRQRQIDKMSAQQAMQGASEAIPAALQNLFKIQQAEAQALAARDAERRKMNEARLLREREYAFRAGEAERDRSARAAQLEREYALRSRLARSGRRGSSRLAKLENKFDSIYKEAEASPGKPGQKAERLKNIADRVRRLGHPIVADSMMKSISRFRPQGPSFDIHARAAAAGGSASRDLQKEVRQGARSDIRQMESNINRMVAERGRNIRARSTRLGFGPFDSTALDQSISDLGGSIEAETARLRAAREAATRPPAAPGPTSRRPEPTPYWDFARSGQLGSGPERPAGVSAAAEPVRHKDGRVYWRDMAARAVWNSSGQRIR